VATVSVKKFPKVWVIIAVVLLAAVGVGVVVSAQNRAAEAKATANAAAKADIKELIDAVKPLDAALTIGINYQDYGTKVGDALAAVQAVDPDSTQGAAVKVKLLEAISCYDAANDAWKLDVSDDWYTVDANESAYWQFKGYPDAFVSELDGASLLSADDVRQAAWAAAQQMIAEAEVLASS
jgi:hypothetical protein